MEIEDFSVVINCNGNDKQSITDDKFTEKEYVSSENNEIENYQKIS